MGAGANVRKRRAASKAWIASDTAMAGCPMKRRKHGVPSGRAVRQSGFPTGVILIFNIGRTQKVDFDFLSAAERQFAPGTRASALAWRKYAL